MKVLNLYAGIGGNRKLWGGVSVTAVELNEKIARVYKDQHSQDMVVIGDAHQYLLDHYSEFEFIWSSPPCQSHSKMIRSGRNRKARYADLSLYEEILFLKHNFKGNWVVENVIPYYEPPIAPTIKLGRHLFWSNFNISQFQGPEFKNFINRQNLEAKKDLQEWLGISYEGSIYYDGNHCPTQVLRNCVHPETGLHILNCARGIINKSVKQQELFI